MSVSCDQAGSSIQRAAVPACVRACAGLERVMMSLAWYDPSNAPINPFVVRSRGVQAW